MALLLTHTETNKMNQDNIKKQYWLTKDKDVLIKILLMQEEIIANYEETIEKIKASI